MNNFEKIKSNRKLNKLNAVEFEESKRKVKNKHCDRREMRKVKRAEVDIV
jgi:hypothetical protein